MDNVNRIRVGHIAPRIILDDSEGKKLDSYSLVGKKNLIIVFNKGVKSENCISWLEELNKCSEKIDLWNGMILAISVDEPRVMKKLKQKMGWNFTLLCDKNSEAISAYGVLDTSSEKVEPHPATFVVDRSGIIRYRKAYPDYKDKPTAEEILSILEEKT
jgi:peroxiredoxin